MNERGALKSLNCDQLRAAHWRTTDEIVTVYQRFQADYGRKSRAVVMQSTPAVMEAVATLLAVEAHDLDAAGWARLDGLRRLYDRAARLSTRIALCCGECHRSAP